MSNHSLTKLSFQSLNDLSNGAVGDAVNEAIRRALRDLHDSRDAESRKIVLQVAIRSAREKDGRSKFIATPTVQVVLPKVKPIKTHGWIEVSGESAEGLFKVSCAKNPDQLTFQDILGDDE